MYEYFEVQYLNKQESDRPSSYLFLCSHFHTISGYIICLQNCVTSNMTEFESHGQTSINLHVVNLKQPFPNNCTILMLHIILNLKLRTITSFQMAYNMAVCTVVTLNSIKIGFSHSTSTFKSLSNKLDTKTRFAVSVVGILYQSISLTDIPGSLGSKETRL